MLAHDTKSTLAAALDLHKRAGKPNLFIKIPGTAGRPARHRGGDLRRRSGQRHAAVLARAICRGGRSLSARRRAAHRGGAEPGRRLGRLAVRQPLGRRGRRQGPGRARQPARHRRSPSAPTRPICELLASPRFQRAANAGARAQRLLWASTGTKDPKASDTLYVKALAAPFTVNTMPEGTPQGLRRSRRGRRRRWRRMAATARRFSPASPRRASTSTRSPPGCRTRAPSSFVKSWNDLMARIDSKRTAMRKAS